MSRNLCASLLLVFAMGSPRIFAQQTAAVPEPNRVPTIRPQQSTQPEPSVTDANELLNEHQLVPVSDGNCPVGDVKAHLDWCSRDHGYNEGAECGLKALTGSGVQLPADIGQQALGNAWDRTNMMGATVAAWKAGAKDAAVKAAVCCQVHDGGNHACVQNHADAVKQWLNGH